jgi:hypothetical protein
MNIAEYLIKCPNCKSDTHLTAEESNPVIFKCCGCGRSVVVHNNTVFTVSSEYVSSLVKKYKSKVCGRILDAHVSDGAKNIITRDKLEELHELLEKSSDVKDFIKNI